MIDSSRDTVLQVQRQKWQNTLVRLLSVPRTKKDVTERLRQKGCPADLAQKLIERFEELGMIDDRVYARLMIVSKRAWSMRRIRDELHLRGVNSDDVDAAIDEALADGLISDDEELCRALELLRSWHSLLGMTSAKLCGRLERRGFSSSVICEALKVLAQEDDDI